MRKNKRRLTLDMKREIKKEEQKKKRNAVIIVLCAVVLTIAAVCIITALPHYVRMEERDGKLIDTKTGIAYLAAPINYEPTVRLKPAYAKMDGNYFYPVKGAEVSQWLSVDINGSYLIYYQEDIALPSLADFEASGIYVCIDGEEGIASYALVEDKGDISSVLYDLHNGKNVEIPNDPLNPPKTVYTLRFASAKYSWLYYIVTMPVYDDACYYIDRCTGKTVKADSTILSYLDSNELEDGRESTNSSSDTSSGTENS